MMYKNNHSVSCGSQKPRNGERATKRNGNDFCKPMAKEEAFVEDLAFAIYMMKDKMILYMPVCIYFKAK